MATACRGEMMKERGNGRGRGMTLRAGQGHRSEDGGWEELSEERENGRCLGLVEGRKALPLNALRHCASSDDRRFADHDE